MAKPTKRTDRAREAFLKTLGETCNVSEAARSAGVARSTVYDWRDDAEFARAWDDVEASAGDKLEQVAYERAISGQSDRMLEILLKGHRPKFRDKQLIGNDPENPFPSGFAFEGRGPSVANSAG